MPTNIDLLADLGEGFGPYRMSDDDALLTLVSSANIACGFHAGDPRIMEDTVGKCVSAGVAIGAHPGLPDRVSFGRRHIDMTEQEVRTDTLYQLGALSAFTKAQGARIRYLTPHGRLGNLVSNEPIYARGTIDAVASFDPEIIVVALAGSFLRDYAAESGVRVATLAPGDRAFNDDGSLLSRSLPGAVITDPEVVRRRVVRMVTSGLVQSVNGVDVKIEADTLLLHGDTPGAVDLARQTRADLETAGVSVRPLYEFFQG